MLAGSGAKSVVALASIFSISLLASCSGSDKGTGPSGGNATVQFANAHPGSNLVLYSNGTVVGPAVGYRNSGNCHLVEAGDVNFSLRQSGILTDLIDFHPDPIVRNRNYTVFAAGAGEVPFGVVLPDTFGTVASGRAKLRIFNATHSSFRFDVYIGGTAGSSLTGATKAHTNLGFLDHAMSDLPTGGTLIRLTVTGFTNVVGTFNYTLTPQSMNTLVITVPPTAGDDFLSFLVPACPQ